LLKRGAAAAVETVVLLERIVFQAVVAAVHILRSSFWPLLLRQL
jgi:hypothetical protein